MGLNSVPNRGTISDLAGAVLNLNADELSIPPVRASHSQLIFEQVITHL
jgi:hypothetical protein